jgi:hypothetical protein
MTTIGLALGLLLPGPAVLAETAQEQKEMQVRTERQQMVQTGSQAAGEQERIQEQTRTREEKKAHDQSGEMKKQQKKKGSGATAAGDHTPDRDRQHDRDRVHEPSGGGSQHRSGSR